MERTRLAYCGTKLRYPSKKDALTKINTRLKRGNNRPDLLRAYDCRACGGWHLTSEEKWEER